MSADKNDPSQMSESRNAMEPFLKMIHTILDGTYAMRRAGPQYLPPHPNESQQNYDARLQRTTLLNILEDSIDNACARLFDEPVRIEGQVPPELHDWAHDIDMMGNSLHEFSNMAMHHALAYGQVHVLVDYPSANPALQGDLGDGDFGEAMEQGLDQIDGRGPGPGLAGDPNAGAPRQNSFARTPGNDLGSKAGDARQGQPGRAGGDAYYADVYGEEGEEPDQTGNGLNARRSPQAYQDFDGPARALYEAGVMPWWAMAGYDAPPELNDVARPEQTIADARLLGMRPYLCLIPHTNLLAIYTARVGGETIVTHMRILEEDVVRDGFSEKRIKRVRVLEPGRWQIWLEAETGGGWRLDQEGELRKNADELWDRVPVFSFHCGKRKGVFDVKPPFLDLAYENVAHWQSSSDQANILAQERFPMLAVSGFEGDIQTPMGDDDEEGPDGPAQMPFAIGPNAVLTTGEPSGKWYYVEPTGASIDHGGKDLDRREKNMRAMGLEPLMPNQGKMGTATEAGIDEAKARSPIEEWARRLEFKLTQALTCMLDWQGLPGQPELHFKSKVSIGPQGAQDFMNLTQMRMGRNLSKLTILEEAKRRRMLPPTFDTQEKIARIIIEGPTGDMGPYIGLPPALPPDPYQAALPPPG